MKQLLSPFRKTLLSVALGICFTSCSWAAEPAAPQVKGPLPLQEIRQFTDVYAAVKAFYVDDSQTTDRQL